MSSESVEESVRAALDWLEAAGDPGFRDDLGTRYGIHTDHAFGVPMKQMKALAKQLGTDHDLAIALWDSGWYEARMVATMVDDPARVSARQMDAWCRDLDNWAICDTACFNLFDRTPHAWKKIDRWAASDQEFVKRAGFALLWAIAIHDKDADDDQFARRLPLIEAAATDERHLVEKAVAMALRAIGKRRPLLREEVLAVAERLAASDAPPARRTGKSALREV